MNVEKKKLEKSKVELSIELSLEEFTPYIKKGAEKISKDVKIEGFRPGKVPLDILKGKVGEMTILEEAANLAINKVLVEEIKKHVEEVAFGQPQISITKLAPDNPLVFKAVVSILPEVEISNYKELDVKIGETKATKEELEKTMNELKEMNVKEAAVAREIKETDKTIVDIEMFLDNVPVEGGQGKGTAVIIGKDYVVPGFDKNLIGAKKGDTRNFKLPYPKDFHQKNLAGKVVEFKVKIIDVFSREFPELDEEFAKKYQYKNVEDLKKNIEININYQKKNEANQKVEREILDKIIEKSKFGDLPDELVEHESDQLVHEMEHNITSQGGKFEDYLSHIGKSVGQLKLEMAPEAVKRVKTSLLIREIAQKEKIMATEEDVNKEVAKLLLQYKDNKEAKERIESDDYKGYLMNMIANRKVIEKLRKWNIK